MRFDTVESFVKVLEKADYSATGQGMSKSRRVILLYFDVRKQTFCMMHHHFLPPWLPILTLLMSSEKWFTNDNNWLLQVTIRRKKESRKTGAALHSMCILTTDDAKPSIHHFEE